MKFSFALSGLILSAKSTNGFTPQMPNNVVGRASGELPMALDSAMESRLDGISRSYQALTERLGDPDVIGDSKLLQKVMSDRARSEEVVLVYEDYCRLKEELEGATELFQEAGDDPELKEMARAEMKEIEPQLETLEEKMKILLLPKDPNDERNVMLEIRAGTGGSEASIFAGT
jgi:peptide chain release factor 1